MFSASTIDASVAALQTILDAIPNPVFLKDRQHRLVIVNQAMCALIGLRREEIVNHADTEYVPAEQTHIFWKVDDEVFATGLPSETEEVLTDGSGALRVYLARKRLIHLPTTDGTQPFIIAVISDVTRFREAEARAQYLAAHDALTGLANRTQLADRLEGAIDAARRTDTKVALLLLDLDGFKTVNDLHGHPAGDALLQVIGKRLARLVRTTDTVARFGGDEFCVLQEAPTQPKAAFDLAERILSSLSLPVVIDGARIAISGSIGIAVFPDDGTTLATLLKKADRALYSVKRSGRRNYLREDGGPLVDHSGAWSIESDMSSALAEGQFWLAFQPIAAATDGGVRGFEALIRWRHPTRGEISPDVFIPVAETTDLIGPITSWVLHAACVAAMDWPGELQVSVNISSVHLEDRNLPRMVERALAASRLPAHRLELEVAEVALLGCSPRVWSVLGEVKALGVHVALDDFGAGWSSLDTLQNFQFDRIKIDRSFIANLESDARSVGIVRAVLSLGHAFDLPVTAEGVEARGQLTALRQMGCDEIQGFYLGRPAASAILPDTPWPSLPPPQPNLPA